MLEIVTRSICIIKHVSISVINGISVRLTRTTIRVAFGEFRTNVKACFPAAAKQFRLTY